MVNIYSNIKNKFSSSSERSKEAVKGVLLSVLAKMISVLSSLLIVPLTIDYVNPTQYGIWLTLSSIIGWVTFFDLGLGNGFRNRFAEAKAKGDIELAKRYLSTTYFAVFTIVFVVFLIILVGNKLVNWSSILNVDNCYADELSKIFVILAAFFCMNMVANLVCSMLTADQKAGVASMIQGGGQFLSLISICILTRISEGSLTNLALYFAGMPCLFTIVVSVIIYSSKKYRNISPHFSYVKISLIRNIMGLGVKFFVIYLCIILLFQIMNIVISRELGPESVTEYNIAYKYFLVLNMVLNIIVLPFWSAFTDAYQKSDYGWMKSVTSKLEMIGLASIPAAIIMVLLSDFIYQIWIGNDVTIRYSLSIMMAVYMVLNCIATIYMTLINGIGTIRLQLVLYVITAVFSWPLLAISCRSFGLTGVLFFPTIVFFLQAFVGKIQLTKILNKTAKGIWFK